MPRAEFSTKIKVAAFKRADGKCEGCTARLYPGRYQYDHRIPDGLGGEPTLDNCQVLCDSCHSTKTHDHDRPIMAKADKIMKKYAGIKTKRGFRAAPEGYNSWTRRFDR